MLIKKLFYLKLASGFIFNGPNGTNSLLSTIWNTPRNVLIALTNPSADAQRYVAGQGGIAGLMAEMNPLSHMQRQMFPPHENINHSVERYMRMRDAALQKIKSYQSKTHQIYHPEFDSFNRYLSFVSMTQKSENSQRNQFEK